jgi:hypothetical protein
MLVNGGITGLITLFKTNKMRKIFALFLITISLATSAQKNNNLAILQKDLIGTTVSRGNLFDYSDSSQIEFSEYRMNNGGKIIVKGNKAIDTVEIDTSTVKVIKAAGKSITVKDLFKKDTVLQIGYVIDKIDTSVVEGLNYIEKNRVKYSSPGYLIISRKAITFDGKNYQWIDQEPILIGALNNKKKQITPINKPVKNPAKK